MTPHVFRALGAHESLAALCKRGVRAVRLERALSVGVATEWASAVMQSRTQWTADFSGDQFSLGKAWYTHLESGRERLYFRDAARANATVENALPGMQGEVLRLLGAFVGAPVSGRPAYCGPGVHVFLPDCPVAKLGGSIHFDLEGLRNDAERQARALSVVIMLQPAKTGGGLRLWPGRYRTSLHATPAQVKRPFETLPYRTGDAIVFESQRLHQIEPFSGDRPRISITAHAIERSGGTWEVWF